MFMEHAIKLSEAVQLVDNGPSSWSNKKDNYRCGGNHHDKEDGKDGSKESVKTSARN